MLNVILPTFNNCHILTRQMMTHRYMFTNINRAIINAYCFTNTFTLMNIGIPSSVISLVQLTQFFLVCPLKRYVVMFILLLRHFIKKKGFHIILHTCLTHRIAATLKLIKVSIQCSINFCRFCEISTPLMIPTVSSFSFCL